MCRKKWLLVVVIIRLVMVMFTVGAMGMSGAYTSTAAHNDITVAADAYVNTTTMSPIETGSKHKRMYILLQQPNFSICRLFIV